MGYHNNNGNRLHHFLNPVNHVEFLRVAENFVRKAGVATSQIGCNMFSIYKFQKLMPGYTITVYDEKRNSGNTHILRVEGSGNKRIDLFYLKELQHFVCIKSRTEFFGQSVECPNCQFLHKNQNTHFCKTKCTMPWSLCVYRDISYVL